MSELHPAENRVSPAPQRAARQDWTWPLLLAIVLLGGAFRSINLTLWDSGTYLHPDERFLIYTANQLRTPPSFADYLKSGCSVAGRIPAAKNPTDPPDSQEPTVASGCNTLNPRNYNWSRMFVYGTLPTTLNRLVSDRIHGFNPKSGEPLASAEDVRDVGRTLSMLFDIGTIIMTFLVGARLYGRRIGLLAALFYALSVLPIQLSHFFTVDAPTGFFTLLTVYWCVRLAQTGRLWLFAPLGLSIGAAMACRATMATLGLLGAAAVASWLITSAGDKDTERENQRTRRSAGDEDTERENQRTGRSAESGRPEQRTRELKNQTERSDRDAQPDEAQRPDRAQPSWNLGALFDRRALVLYAGLMAAGALSLLTFRVLQPDAFVGTSFFDLRPEPRFVDNLKSAATMVSGELDFPPGQQWAMRTPFLFSMQNIVLWGLGPALGIAAWAGWLAALWRLVSRRHLAHLIPVVWIGFYYAWQGGQFVMTMRYYGLLYGLLCIMAAWGIGALYRRASAAPSDRHGWRRRWRLVPAIAVIAVTALWAFAFTRIYTEPFSRYAASRWIYQNIPPGSTITGEQWDDSLPVGVGNLNSSRYIGIQMSPYSEDEAIKYDGRIKEDGTFEPGLLDQLDQADYLIYSSNRVYDSAGRLRPRFPALIRYYNAVFDGSLGFAQVADIHSYPQLFGIDIPTPLLAEEAFSVYDHPRVLIFKKTPSYSRANAEALITDGIVWDEVYRLETRKISRMPSALRLTDTQWPAYREAGTWVARFGGLANAAPWLVWLLLLEGLGFAAFAMLYRLLPQLPDRGYALAKIVGLLLPAWAAWLLASLGNGTGHPWLANGPGGAWLIAGVFLAVGAAAAYRRRAELRALWRGQRQALLTAEALFLVAFFAFLVIRAINPDIWHPARGGEKPMDLAFLTAVVKSPAFPPYDPWYAGGFLNYYYFGFVLIGFLIQLSGIAPATAYNLAVPTIFALTAIGAWGAAYNLLAARAADLARHLQRQRRAIAAGLLAALFAVVCGNLANAVWLLPGSADTQDQGLSAECRAQASYAAQNACRDRSEWAFWDATRITGIARGDGTINEFPFFTFLFADLHAHMIALPLTLAVLNLLIALVRRRTSATAAGWLAIADPLRRSWPELALLALLVGALRATNTWDFPTAAGLGALALAIAGLDRWRRGQTAPLAAGGALASFVAVLLGATLLFQPFTSSFATDYAGFERWTGERTPLPQYLMINGPWLFFAVCGALLLALRARLLSRAQAAIVGGALALLTAGLLATGSDPLLLQVVLIGVGTALLLALALRGGARLQIAPPNQRRGPEQLPLPLFGESEVVAERGPISSQLPLASPVTLLTIALGLSAVGITLLTEILVAKGDIGRMNTVFKFGMQSWLLFAVVGAVTVVQLWSLASHRLDNLRLSWPVWAFRAAVALLTIGMLAYPLTATPARLADRYDRSIDLTLDGTAYMASPKSGWAENDRPFTFAEDAAALEWMRQHIDGTPIVLEAHQEAYRWGGRVTVYTGLPTILGWPWHETQQRQVANAGPSIESRKAFVRDVYGSVDSAAKLKGLQLYGVEYVYVGQLERSLYPADGLDTFAAMAKDGQIEQVYSAGSTQIYRVSPGRHAPGVLTIGTVVHAPVPHQMVSAELPAPLETLPNVVAPGWNVFARSDIGATVVWLLVWYAIGILGLPIAALVFGTTRDGGWVWARPIGLLLFGYLVWMPVSMRLYSYDILAIAVGWGLLLALGALSLGVLGRRGAAASWGGSAMPWSGAAISEGVDILRDIIAARRRQMIAHEAVFLAGFAALLLIRWLNPDLWHPTWGGEKPFEFGFLNAMLRSPVMPPYDPFMSGETINYYYYGFFLVSLPVKIAGIPPAIAFNLIVPTLYGLVLAGAWGLGAQLTGRRWGGAAAAGLVAVAGSLAAAFPVGYGRGLAGVPAALAGGLGGFGSAMGDWFMLPSRIIPHTINEFPAFSYLFADLHPHIIALPFVILLLAQLYTLFSQDPPASATGDLPALLLATLTLGALAAINSWDFPTYGALLGLTLLLQAWRAGGQGWHLARRLLGATLTAIGCGALAIVWYLPFFQNYRAMVSGIGQVTERSATSDYLLIYGMALGIVVPMLLGIGWRLALLFERRHAGAPPPQITPSAIALGLVAGGGQQASLASAPKLALLLAGAALTLLLALGLGGAALGGLGVLPAETGASLARVADLRLALALLLALSGAAMLARRLSRPVVFAIALTCVAWAASLTHELVYIKDHLVGGEWYRMNTVFKFGFQVWLLLALAASALLPPLLRALRRAHPALRTAGAAWLTLLVALAAGYPVVATPSRVALRFSPPGPQTLDGLAFLRTARFNAEYLGGAPIDLAPEADAIDWLLANVDGTPVVLQSSMEFYRTYGARIAANTGFPTIVSPLHASEQHGGDVVAARDNDVRELYQTADETIALRLLSRYHVGYVYIGTIERAAYGAAGLAKFDALTKAIKKRPPMLELAYSNADVLIYRVRPETYEVPALAPVTPRAAASGPQTAPDSGLSETQGDAGPAPAQPADVAPQPALDLPALEAQNKAEPNNAGAAFALGQAYRDAGRPDDAAAVLAVAAAANPGDIGLHHMWGDALTDAKRYAEAEAAYRQAVAISPTGGNYNKLGVGLLAGGNYAQAEVAFRQALAAGTDNAEPYYQLGMVYEAQGQRDQARENYQLYLEQAPKDGVFRAAAEEALARSK